MSIRLKMETLTATRLARVLSVMAIAMAAGHLVQTVAARKQVQMAEAEVVPESGTTAKPTGIVMVSAGSLVAPAEVLARPALQKSVPEPALKLAAASDSA